MSQCLLAHGPMGISETLRLTSMLCSKPCYMKAIRIPQASSEPTLSLPSKSPKTSLLGASWDLISTVIRTLVGVIRNYKHSLPYSKEKPSYSKSHESLSSPETQEFPQSSIPEPISLKRGVWGGGGVQVRKDKSKHKSIPKP